MSLRRVGILGGMGPEATLLLMQRLLAAIQAKDDADHIPLIVDQNPQVPSRIAYLIEGTGPDPTPVLTGMAKRLEGAGAEALAMPCNTAHHFAPAICAATSLPLLNMVTATVAHIKTTGETRIGLLGSPALRKIGLYDTALAAIGATPIYPEDEAALLTAIRKIKSGGATHDTRQALTRLSEDLLQKGAKLQLVACTEFSLIADAIAEAADCVDALDLLAQAIIDFAQKEGV